MVNIKFVMPYRRRRRTRSRRSGVLSRLARKERARARSRARKRKVSKLINYRAGNVSKTGRKPFWPKSKVVKVNVNGIMFNNPAATAESAVHAFNICDLNKPLGTPIFNEFDHASNQMDQQAYEHDDWITAGFQIGRVITSKYKFYVNMRGDSAIKDLIFFWYFSADAISASTVTNDLGSVVRLRQSPGVKWITLSGTEAGGSMYPTSGWVTVPVPSVLGHIKKFRWETNLAAKTVADLQSNVDHLSSTPNENMYLNVGVISNEGVALSPKDVAVHIQITQTIKLTRTRLATGGVKPLDPVGS